LANETPSSKSLNHFTIKIDEIRWEQAKSKHTLQAYCDYLRTFPAAKHEIEAKEKIKGFELADWNRLSAQKNYQGYLDAYQYLRCGSFKPSFVAEAKRKLNEKPRKNTPKPTPVEVYTPQQVEVDWEEARLRGSCEALEPYYNFLEKYSKEEPYVSAARDSLNLCMGLKLGFERDPDDEMTYTIFGKYPFGKPDGLWVDSLAGIEFDSTLAAALSYKRLSDSSFRLSFTQRDSYRIWVCESRLGVCDSVSINTGIKPLEAQFVSSKGDSMYIKVRGGLPPYFLNLLHPEPMMLKLGDKDDGEQVDDGWVMFKLNSGAIPVQEGIYEAELRDIRKTEKTPTRKIEIRGKRRLQLWPWLLPACVLFSGLAIYRNYEQL
jgi:hypothetical protein